VTEPLRWPRQADEFRTDTIHRARVGRRIAERIKSQITQPALGEQMQEMATLFVEIELAMTQARVGREQ